MKKITLIIFSLVLFMASCQKDKVDNNANLPEMELSPNTIIIDSLTALTIQSIDSNHIIFDGNTVQLQKLAVGNIIVSGIATNAPTGFLRKISSILKNGTIYNFLTTEVPLIEAFKNLHIDETTPPLPLVINSVPPDLVLYDRDGNNTTTFDQIKINSDLRLSPQFHIKIDINNYQLDYAKLEGTFESKLTKSITAGGSIGTAKADKVIYSKLIRIITPINIPIIVIGVYLRVSVGFDGSINVQFTASNISTTTTNIYLEYKNKNWDNGFTRVMNNQYTFPGLSGNATAKVFVEPAIDFKLWGSNWAKGSLASQAYLKFTGELLPTLGCKLEGGLSAGLEANLQFFDKQFLKLPYTETFNFPQTLFTCNSLTVTTSPVTSITTTTAIAGGNVTIAGNSSVTSRGVCWSTSQNPTIANTRSIDGLGIGAFISNLTGLIPNTTYYLRAYAINSSDTAYGNEISFTTQSNNPSCGSITDIDGNTYTSVTIGTQCWTKENLNVTRYRNGDLIPQVTDSAQWANLTTGAWCYYNNNPSTASTYGRLYNGYALTDSRNIAPAGWHVPNNTEFQTLITYLGGDSVAGGKLKATNVWSSPNTGATNSSGFSALPGGGRHFLDNYTHPPPYYLVDFAGIPVFSVIHGINGRISLYHLYKYLYLSVGGLTKSGGSVRLIKD